MWVCSMRWISHDGCEWETLVCTCHTKHSDESKAVSFARNTEATTPRARYAHTGPCDISSETELASQRNWSKLAEKHTTGLATSAPLATVDATTPQVTMTATTSIFTAKEHRQVGRQYGPLL